MGAVSGGARAASWSTTFEGPALAAHALPGEARVALVAAGAPSPTLTSAHAALNAAMTKAARWTLMEVPARPELMRLDDPAIVARLGAQPLDAIWIVRAFPGTGGEAGTAIVSVFGLDGELRRAFSASEGVTLAAPDQSVGRGVSGHAVASVMAATAGPGGSSDNEAEKRYAAEHIHFGRQLAVAHAPGGATFVLGAREGWFQGDRPLDDDPALLRAVGEVERAEELESMGGAAATTQIIGGSGALIGSTLLLVGAVTPDFDPVTGEPSDRTDPLVVTGAIVGGVGLAVFIVGLAMTPNGLGPGERRTLVQRHNAELRQRLGLGADPDVGAASRRPRVRLLDGPGDVGLSLGVEL